jgi:hypothetical protein
MGWKAGKPTNGKPEAPSQTGATAIPRDSEEQRNFKRASAQRSRLAAVDGGGNAASRSLRVLIP